MSYISEKFRLFEYSDGQTPFINDDGNWQIGDTIGPKAAGVDGVSFSGVVEYYTATLATNENKPVFNPNAISNIWKQKIEDTQFGTKDNSGVDYKYLWNVEGIKSTDENGTETIDYLKDANGNIIIDLYMTYNGGRVPKNYINYYATNITNSAPTNQPTLNTDGNTISLPSGSTWKEASQYAGSADADTYLFEISFVEYVEKDENGKNLYAKISGPTLIGHNGTNGGSLQVRYQNADKAENLIDSKWQPSMPQPEEGKKTFIQQKLSTEDVWSTPIQISAEDGTTPTIEIVKIGDEQYWKINGEVTNIKAEGKDGDTPVVEIVDGVWTIDGVSTGTNATGPAGKDGTDIEYVYYRSQSEVGSWEGHQPNAEEQNGWENSPLGITSTWKYEYMSVRTKPSGIEQSWGPFSTPVIWSKWGEKGFDGDGVEYKYYLKNEESEPTYPGTDWMDEPQGVNINNKFEYVAVIKTTVNKETGESIVSTSVALWSKYGEDGTNGKSVIVVYKYAGEMSKNPSTGSNYIPAGKPNISKPQNGLDDWSETDPSIDSLTSGSFGSTYGYVFRCEGIKTTKTNGAAKYSDWTEPQLYKAWNNLGLDYVDYAKFVEQTYYFTSDALAWVAGGVGEEGAKLYIKASEILVNDSNGKELFEAGGNKVIIGGWTVAEKELSSETNYVGKINLSSNGQEFDSLVYNQKSPSVIAVYPPLKKEYIKGGFRFYSSSTVGLSVNIKGWCVDGPDIVLFDHIVIYDDYIEVWTDDSYMAIISSGGELEFKLTERTSALDDFFDVWSEGLARGSIEPISGTYEGLGEISLKPSEDFDTINPSLYILQDGSLYAKHAKIEGQSTIGGWGVNNSSIWKQHTDGDKAYRVLINGTLNNTVADSASFEIQLYQDGTYQKSPFYVRPNGTLYAENATFDGNINFISGTIGGANGFTVGTGGINASIRDIVVNNTTYQQDVAIGMAYLTTTYKIKNTTGEAKTTVQASWTQVAYAGKAYANSLSDIRVKTNVESLSNAYNQFFDMLQPKRYQYIHGESDRYHTGFIAQEVVEALNISGLDTQQFAAVCLDFKDEQYGYWSLRRDEFVALNTWQIQLLKPRMTTAEEKIAALELEVSSLKSELENLKKS